MVAPTRIVSVATIALFFALVCRGSIIMNWLDEPLELGGWWNPSNTHVIDLNNDGRMDFSFSASYPISVDMRSENDNRYLITPDPPPNIGGGVAALDAGHQIGAASGDGYQDWFGNDYDYWSVLMQEFSTGREGEFWNTPDAWGPPWDPRSPPEMRSYVGVEFAAMDGVHYGWIEVQGHWSYPYAQIYGWAYESTPGMGIMAGAIAIPEPSTTMLLAGGLLTIGCTVRRPKRRRR